MSKKNKYLQDGPVIHHYKYRRKPNRSLGGDIGVYIVLAIFSAIMFFGFHSNFIFETIK